MSNGEDDEESFDRRVELTCTKTKGTQIGAVNSVVNAGRRISVIEKKKERDQEDQANKPAGRRPEPVCSFSSREDHRQKD